MYYYIIYILSNITYYEHRTQRKERLGNLPSEISGIVPGSGSGRNSRIEGWHDYNRFFSITLQGNTNQTLKRVRVLQ